MSSDTPADRIRAHLERKGGSTRVEVGRLLGTWGLADDPSDTNRQLIARALEEVGVVAEPALEATPVGREVSLRIADTTTLAQRRRTRDEASAAARSVARSRGPRDEAPGPPAGQTVDEAPVEIPPALPRGLLATGAAGIAGSLLLPWFGAQRGGEEITGLSTGWEWLTVIDLLLLVVALAALALGVVMARRPDVDGPALAVAGLACLGAACVSYRIVVPPGSGSDLLVLDVSVRSGPFLALLALGLVVAGAGLSSPSREGRFLRSGQAPVEPPT